MAVDNKAIGRFQLTGIPPAPRGTPQIEVGFDIDANGILHVAAKDKATSKEQKIRIEASGGLSDAEIDKMVKDAESHAGEDKERKEKIDTRNQLDSLVYQVEKDTAEWGDKVSGEARERLEAAVERAKKALKQDELGELNAARDELMQAFSAAGQQFYQAQAAEQAPPEGAEAGAEAPGAEAGADAGAGSAEEDVVDERLRHHPERSGGLAPACRRRVGPDHRRATDDQPAHGAQARRARLRQAGRAQSEGARSVPPGGNDAGLASSQRSEGAASLTGASTSVKRGSTPRLPG
jgi:hypothetical protein